MNYIPAHFHKMSKLILCLSFGKTEYSAVKGVFSPEILSGGCCREMDSYLLFHKDCNQAKIKTKETKCQNSFYSYHLASFSFRDSLRGLLQRDVWHKAKATHPGVSSQNKIINICHLILTICDISLLQLWHLNELEEQKLEPTLLTFLQLVTPFPPLTLDPL